MSAISHLRGLLGLAALVAPVLAHAAPVSPDKNATATVVIAPPASVRKLEDLNFDYLSVTTAGTAIVDPNTDDMTTPAACTTRRCSRRSRRSVRW